MDNYKGKHLLPHNDFIVGDTIYPALGNTTYIRPSTGESAAGIEYVDDKTKSKINDGKEIAIKWLSEKVNYVANSLKNMIE